VKYTIVIKPKWKTGKLMF
jgi:hypothetical protein